MVLESYHSGLRQKCMFSLFFNSIEINLVKTFKLPDLEKEIQKFGSAGTYWDHKEPGRILVGEWEMEKAIKANESDDWVWVQFNKIFVNPVSENDLLFYELTSDRSQHKRQWTLHNAWTQKNPGLEFDSMSSDIQLEKVIGCCDWVDFKNL